MDSPIDIACSPARPLRPTFRDRVFCARTIRPRKPLPLGLRFGAERGSSDARPEPPRGKRMDLNGKRLRLLYPDIHGLERGKYLFGEGGGIGPRGVLCRRLSAHPRSRDPHGAATRSSTWGCPTSMWTLDRESLRPSWEPEHRDRHRRRPLPRRSGGAGPTPRPASRPSTPGDAMGLEPQISVRARVLPDGARRRRRMAAGLAAGRIASTERACRSTPPAASRTWCTTALACGFPVESWSSEYDDVRLRGEHPLQRRASPRPTTRSCSGCWSARSPSATASSRRSWAGRSPTAAAAGCT